MSRINHDRIVCFREWRNGSSPISFISFKQIVFNRFVIDFVSACFEIDQSSTGFRQKLDVQQLAAIADLSVRQLERRFRQTFQTSPRAYLVRMRILAACEILETTNQPITDVALAVGFYDHSDFSRQFRRVMGQSPTHYRRQRAGRVELPPAPT